MSKLRKKRDMSGDEQLTRVRDYIEEYMSRHNVKNCGLSDRYNLSEQWNHDSFPNADMPGCYFIFDDKDELLYIGKASLGSTVGRRLATYFYWDKVQDTLAHSHSGWGDSNPTWIRTLPVEDAYQAASLEEFLIDRLQPSYNSRK